MFDPFLTFVSLLGDNLLMNWIIGRTRKSGLRRLRLGGD